MKRRLQKVSSFRRPLIGKRLVGPIKMDEAELGSHDKKKNPYSKQLFAGPTRFVFISSHSRHGAQNFNRVFWWPHFGQGAISVPAFPV